MHQAIKKKIQTPDIFRPMMPGVTIGINAVVGAFSFVNRDIPDDAVACGVPVKVIKPIPEEN